jgi:RNA polymerase sigma factor (sigma-70 family)
MRAYLDHARRRSSTEVSFAQMPETGGEQYNDLRITMLRGLDGLPPRDRAIVVLRYWEDQTVESTARALNLPVETVKKQSSRALSRLRELFAEDRVSLFSRPD